MGGGEKTAQMQPLRQHKTDEKFGATAARYQQSNSCFVTRRNLREQTGILAGAGQANKPSERQSQLDRHAWIQCYETIRNLEIKWKWGNHYESKNSFKQAENQSRAAFSTCRKASCKASSPPFNSCCKNKAKSYANTRWIKSPIVGGLGRLC